MRHGNKGNALGRKKAHREALMKNQAISLILHKRIFTTLAKAKSLRVYCEPLVTRAKYNTTHSRRLVFSFLQSKEAVDLLFNEIREKVGDRPGGYLRVIKTGPRKSDSAEMAMIEFVDYNTIYSQNEETTEKAKTTRRSRAKKKSTFSVETPASTATSTEAVDESMIVDTTSEKDTMVVTESAESAAVDTALNEESMVITEPAESSVDSIQEVITDEDDASQDSSDDTAAKDETV